MGFTDFKYEEHEETSFKPLPVGDYKIRIKECEKCQSRTGKDMLRFVFEVSGHKNLLFHYIVDGEYFNANISRFFDAFPQIEKGNFNVSSWVGKIGACHTKLEEYNGELNAKVHYFIPAYKQNGLPWVEPNAEVPKANNDLSDAPVFMNIETDDEELPFD